MLESDNLDRARITKLLESLILPEMTRHLISIGNKFSLDQSEVNQLKLALGNTWNMKLVSDIQAMVKKNTDGF